MMKDPKQRQVVGMADCRGRRAARAPVPSRYGAIFGSADFPPAIPSAHHPSRRLDLLAMPHAPNAVYRRPSPGCACWPASACRRWPPGAPARCGSSFPAARRRGVAVAAWAALHLWLLGLLIAGRPWRAGRRWWAGWALAVVALLVWWHTLRPSNDRDWADEVSRMPRGTVQGDHVRLQDVRNFDWRGDADYDARWDTRDYDLSRLRSVDMILSTWGMPPSPTLVSFGFDDGQRVVFSVEIRKERGEQFSELGGFFKQFELSVIAADERDIVRVRTAVRGETVSIYPIRMPPEAMRALFLSYVDTANALRAEPRFYHTVTPTAPPSSTRWCAPSCLACRSTTAFCCPATCPSTCTNTAAWTPAGRWTRSGAMPTSPSARPGRATRRRSRKPYANLSCPPTMKHSLGLVALRRAAADPGDRRLRRRQGRVRQHAGLHRPTTRRRAHHRQAQRRRQRRWPCWAWTPTNAARPRSTAPALRGATAWTPSASCPRCPRSGCCMPWSWNASAPSPRPTATSCWTPTCRARATPTPTCSTRRARRPSAPSRTARPRCATITTMRCSSPSRVCSRTTATRPRPMPRAAKAPASATGTSTS